MQTRFVKLYAHYLSFLKYRTRLLRTRNPTILTTHSGTYPVAIRICKNLSGIKTGESLRFYSNGNPELFPHRGLKHANRQFIIYDSRTDTVPITESGPSRCRILRIMMLSVTCPKNQKGLIFVVGEVQHTPADTKMQQIWFTPSLLLTQLNTNTAVFNFHTLLFFLKCNANCHKFQYANYLSVRPPRSASFGLRNEITYGI